jgi:hypothetical protein
VSSPPSSTVTGTDGSDITPPTRGARSRDFPPRGARRRRLPLAVAVVVLLVALVLSICVGVALGTVSVPLDSTIAALVHHLVPGAHVSGFTAV